MNRSRLAVAAIAAGLAACTTTIAGASAAQPQPHRPSPSSPATPAASSVTAAIDRELAGLADLRRSLPADQQHLVDELKRSLETERARLLALAGGRGQGQDAPAPGTTPSFFGPAECGRAPVVDPRPAPGPEGSTNLPGEDGGSPLRREQVTVTAESRAWMADLSFAGTTGRRTGTTVVRDGFGFRIVTSEGPVTPASTDPRALSFGGAVAPAASPAPRHGNAAAAAPGRTEPVRVRLYGARAGAAAEAATASTDAANATSSTRRPAVSGRRAPVTPRPAPGPGGR